MEPGEANLAKAAYEKWCETFGPIEVTGAKDYVNVVADLVTAATKPWDQLPEAQQNRWSEIAEAVIEVYEDPEQLGPIARDMDPEELERFKSQFSSIQEISRDRPTIDPTL